jgi:LPS-assembly protein
VKKAALLVGLAIQLSVPAALALEPRKAPAESNNTPLFESRFSTLLNSREIEVFNYCAGDTDVLESNNKIGNTSIGDSEPHTVLLTADKVPQNNQTTLALEGNVSMTSATSQLKADKLFNDKTKQQILASGGVSVETYDSLLRAESFVGNQKTKRSKLTEVDFHFFANNANGKAEYIETNEQNVATLKELTYSTCPANNESWRFSASELQLDQQSGWGEAWGMWLKVKGIPVFYFPYVNFPLGEQRKTGILQPALSNDDKNGLDVLLPFYWNISPHTDATFNFRNIQNRGSQFGTEIRYLTESTESELSFEWLADDRLVNSILALEPGLSGGRYGLDEDRWALSFNSNFQLSQHWSGKVNASKVSDRDYFTDLGAGVIDSYGTNSQTQLVSQFDISYQDDIWLVSLLAESTQSLVGDEPYRILPSILASADYYHQDSGLHWQFTSDLTQYTHTDINQIEGIRVNLAPSLSYPIRTTYSWFTPKLTYQSTRYQQDSVNNQSKIDINRNLPIVSIDSGLYFDRTIEWNDKSVTHSLEPRAFYAYIPFREQQQINNFGSRLPEFSFSQLWQANRFAGVDRVGDTNHLAFALTNRFTDEQTGEQLFAFSFGRKNYFEDRRVLLDEVNRSEISTHSTWLAELSYQPSSVVELSGFIEWSDDNRDANINSGTNLARSQIKFEPKPNHIVNLSHRLRNKDGFNNEEIDLSFAWPINDEWRVVGRWYNDIEVGRTSETLFGFEYQSCCFAINLVTRRYLDVRLDAFGNPVTESLNQFNSGIELQFVFKGLGSAGNDVSRLLEKSIRGYSARN